MVFCYNPDEVSGIFSFFSFIYFLIQFWNPLDVVLFKSRKLFCFLFPFLLSLSLSFLKNYYIELKSSSFFVGSEWYGNGRLNYRSWNPASFCRTAPNLERPVPHSFITCVTFNFHYSKGKIYKESINNKAMKIKEGRRQ